MILGVQCKLVGDVDLGVAAGKGECTGCHLDGAADVAGDGDEGTGLNFDKNGGLRRHWGCRYRSRSHCG